MTALGCGCRTAAARGLDRREEQVGAPEETWGSAQRGRLSTVSPQERAGVAVSCALAELERIAAPQGRPDVGPCGHDQ